MPSWSVPSKVLLTCCFLQAVSARLSHSLPEDTYAFPKYRVTFLNGLPIQRDKAERWLHDGLRGGESEFLERPWNAGPFETPSSLRGIGSGDSLQDGEVRQLS